MILLTTKLYSHNNIEIEIEETKVGTQYTVALVDETQHRDLLMTNDFSNLSDLYDVLGKVIADRNKEQK